MKLEHLFDGDYLYTGALELVVSPFDENKRMQLFGGGDGRVRGERIRGAVEWENAPRFRSDGVFTPNVRGLILCEDGGRIRYETQGFSEPPDPAHPTLRRIVASVRFYSKVDSFAWLNTILGLEEGVIDVSTGRIRTRVLACRHDYELPASEA